MNSNAERLAFADKLIGKTVAEQTAAGNAEGWISSVMFKAVTTTKDLHNIVAFSASIAPAVSIRTTYTTLPVYCCAMLPLRGSPILL